MPIGLRHLSLRSNSMNHTVKNLPPNLKILALSGRSLPQLPPSITHLSFGFHFNDSVDSLPPTITHLTFGHEFNSPVSKLPKSLLVLHFGSSFNMPVDSLPPTVKIIVCAF